MLITVYPERKELTTMAVEGPVISNSEPVFQSEPRDYRWAGVVVAVLGTFLLASYYLLPWLKLDYEELVDDYRAYAQDTDLINDARRELFLDGFNSSADDIEKAQESCYSKGVTGYEITRNYNCEDEEYNERDEDYDTLMLGLEYGIIFMPIVGSLFVILGLLIMFRGGSSRIWAIVLILAILVTIYPRTWERAYIFAQHRNLLDENYNVSSLNEYEEEHDREARRNLEFGLNIQALAFENATQLTIQSLPGILLVLLALVMIILHKRGAMPVEEDIPPMNSL
jgi:hypothetical protein